MQAYADDTIIGSMRKAATGVKKPSGAPLGHCVCLGRSQSIKMFLHDIPNGRISMARRLPTIRLAGINLNCVNEMKTLGIIFDPWLT